VTPYHSDGGIFVKASRRHQPPHELSEGLRAQPPLARVQQHRRPQQPPSRYTAAHHNHCKTDLKAAADGEYMQCVPLARTSASAWGASDECSLHSCAHEQD
jgi:hypothetical protein